LSAASDFAAGARGNFSPDGDAISVVAQPQDGKQDDLFKLTKSHNHI